MIAHELIRQLQQLDPFTEVVFNASESSKGGFNLAPIESVDEIETDMGEKYIMISPVMLHGTTGLANN